MTEEMLREWDESPLGGEFSLREVNRKVRTLVAEVRRLKVAETERDVLRGVDCEANGDGPCGVCIKCARTKWYAERDATWIGLAEADAAGYARAERDVVAWLRQRADDMGDGRDELSRDEAVSQGTVYVASDNIEQGAHRGAAKDEAPRGEGE